MVVPAMEIASGPSATAFVVDTTSAPLVAVTESLAIAVPSLDLATVFDTADPPLDSALDIATALPLPETVEKDVAIELDWAASRTVV